MMSASYLRALAHERFVALLLNKSKGDTRSNDQLRQAAAREIIREARSNRSSASVPSTHNGGFELLFQRIWKICQNMAAHADMRTVPARAETVTPTIIAAPIVCNEPVSVSARAENENVVSFPVITGTGKQLIPDSEFPARFVDQTTNNWRASISQNEQIQKQRAEASARHRQTSRYLG
jgi:hypothetical protein